MAQTSHRGGTLTTKPNGPRLKALRGKRKQHDIEQELDLPRGQLTRYENGKPAGINYLLRLAEHYNVQPKELVDLEGLSTTSELLTNLAKLHGATVNFSANGGKTEEPLKIFEQGFSSAEDNQSAGELDEGRESNA